MGEKILYCPLCCGKTFISKEALVKHLSHYAACVSCPICQNQFNDISTLVQHLNNDCISQRRDPLRITENNDDNITTQDETSNNSKLLNLNECIDDYSSNDNPNVKSDHTSLSDNISMENLDVNNKVDMSLLSIQVLKQEGIKNCLQTQELVEENGEKRYVIIGDNASTELLQEGRLVTTQNSDGTISLTTVKDIKSEDDSLPLTEKDLTCGNQEVYSCNTCGVSFTSVLEHIQNYHSDQDVVVEVIDPSLETTESLSESSILPIEMEKEQNGTAADSNAGPRRVITDTGNIVETHYATVPNMKFITLDKDTNTIKKSACQPLLEEEVLDKKGRAYTRKIIQIDKFWDNNVVATKPEVKSVHGSALDDTKPTFHQAVIEEMDAIDGSGKVKVYNCVICNIYVGSLEEFKTHPCKAMKYSCPHCPVAYDNSKSLCAHMKVHKINKQSIGKSARSADASADNPAGTFNCDVCCTIFPTNKSLRLHRRMHDPIKARPLVPPVESGNEDSEHGSSTFHCTECDKFIPVGYRAVHENYHTSSPQFTCVICNRKFHSSDYLVMHMAIHNVDKVTVVRPEKSLPYTCLYCNRQFARPHEKVKHERIHTGEKPHSCEICGKSFRLSYCLTLHMRTHTGARPYECPHCGKRFKAHSVYNHHLLTHSDVRAYKCPYCPKAFKTSVQLAGHKNSHTKPFSCTECNRPFASLYAVRVHTETHRRQNNLKFSCSLCGASYARTFALKDHIKQVHMRDVDNIDQLGTLEKEWEILKPSPADTSLSIISKNEEMETEIATLTMDANDSESVMLTD